MTQRREKVCLDLLQSVKTPGGKVRRGKRHDPIVCTHIDCITGTEYATTPHEIFCHYSLKAHEYSGAKRESDAPAAKGSVRLPLQFVKKGDEWAW